MKIAEGDADPEIVRVALGKLKPPNKVTVVASDSDILIMLIARTPVDTNLSVLVPNVGSHAAKLYNISRIQTKIGSMKNLVLFTHAVTGCDTTSALYSKGKKKSWALLNKNANVQKSLTIFNRTGVYPDEIVLAGEQFLLILYNSQKYSSLDESRLFLYNRGIAKTKLTSTFKLATHPPTSSGARQHLLRVYHQVSSGWETS